MRGRGPTAHLRSTAWLALTAALLLPFAALGASEWNRFRGPNGAGVASDPLPIEFGPAHNVVWSAPVPFGRSSPAIASDRIFLTAEEDDELLTLALDRATGKLLWQRSLPKRSPAILYHGNDSATPSPVTDGRNVYAFFHEAGLVSYDAEGELRWQLDLGTFRNFYGIAASPILVGSDLLVMVVDQTVGSFIVGVDADTGRIRWRRERPGRIESYSTPILYPDDTDPRSILVLGSGWIDAYDITGGETRWSAGGVGVGPVASPALQGDLLVVSAPDQAEEPLPPFEGVLAELDTDASGTLVPAEVTESWMSRHFGFLDLDADGSISRTDWDALREEMQSDAWGIYGLRLAIDGGPPTVLWNLRRSVSYIPTPLLYRGVAYVVKDSILTALDPIRGEVLKRARIARGGATVYASPIAADGHLFIATVEGEVVVLSAGSEWRVAARNDLAEEIYATPAVQGGHLYVRTAGHLHNFSAPEPEGSDG